MAFAMPVKNLPADISYSFQGTAQAFEASTKSLGVLMIISILVIYIVLGILYESFIHPVTILSACRLLDWERFSACSCVTRTSMFMAS